MRFGILGATEVYPADGRRLTVGGPRLRALLVLLLLDAGRVVPRQRLTDDLYGAKPPAGVANALQSQVSRLRQVLSAGPVDPVEFHPAGYRLAVDPEDVDAHQFIRLADAGRAALGAGDPRRAADLLREALALWRGEPLADVTDAPFAAAQAARLRDRRLGATEDRIEAELRLGAAPGSSSARALVTELRELVAADPLRERLHGQLMRALHADGRRSEALAAFAELRRLLAEELGTDPSAELVALHAALLRDEVESRAEAAPSRLPPLPGQLSSFVGREEELRRLGGLLGEARLVTLQGPGGVGKTRLALEAAARHGGEVCLVELAALPAGADVAPAVLAALDLRDAALRVPGGGPRDVTDRLVAALGDRRLLLLLDNCEHVVADAARLTARLLRAAPMVRVLATSREPLGLTGEMLCPVVGLPVPSECAAPELAREYAAVRLFADRATDVAPGFTVDAGTVAAVLRICRNLDGLPLAIELAAARLRALPVAEVAARLDDRFRLLNRGSRVAEPRHQTLRAVVRWSWDLLDEPERRLARRLSVFAGSADLAAIERICGPLGADALDVLTGLVEKSLVDAADGRFRMLETVRAFAAEQLAEAGEADRLRRAHAAYFLDLARAGDVGLRGATQLDWLRRLDADRDDLLAALRRSVAGGDTGMALRLVAALSFYWWLRGLRGEGAALAGRLVDRLGGPPPGLAEEYALCLLVAAVSGAGGAHPPQVGAASDILWELGRPPVYPFLLYLSGTAAGPPPRERISMLYAGQTRAVLLGADPWSQALGSLGTAMVRLLDGRYDEARAELTAAYDGFRTIGERWGMILVLSTLAEVAYRVGDPAAAAGPMAEALRLADELGSALDMAELLRTRADGRLGVGDLDGAGTDYQQVVEAAKPAGAAELVAAAHYGLGEIARRCGDLDRARQLCEQAVAECPAGWFGAEVVRLAALVALGQIADTVGDAPTARARYREVLGATLGVWDVPTVGAAVEGLVRPALRRGEAERAALLLGAASALLRGTGAAPAAQAAPVAAAARAEIGDARFERAFVLGAGLDREQALALLDGR
ncbi:BTAD domain-containing putative transcriptional regulator [Micromonospora soli]|uniref:BTAD domain-containing putative transcriptional regulator n=1 Tax=Micromonospora sp. NBRC 110009 TaxID=3061627 RepID=UPI002671DADA|nr:BTAD domain-containing putative transcriptional regulator [Micromonospora sp. NBRC 110009]WKT97729.1 BTAD domain-containing putative transcriptional regulator [Micromonospora sp. NBRC 110009]